jgi:hypothetical protein
MLAANTPQTLPSCGLVRNQQKHGLSRSSVCRSVVVVHRMRRCLGELLVLLQLVLMRVESREPFETNRRGYTAGLRCPVPPVLLCAVPGAV